MRYVFLALLLILAGCGILFYGRARRKLRELSRAAFGTDDFLQGLKQQEIRYAQMSKAVSGMTRLELPRIQRDFPEFSWDEWRQKCEAALLAYLSALETRSVPVLSGISPTLRSRIALEIRDLQDSGISPRFDRVKIHRTEIVRYEKAPGICRILVQSAVEYHCPDNPPEAGSRLEQARYDMELVYVQDLGKLSDLSISAGVNCPNCGAPITALGAKSCAYCGTAVEPLNLRAWVLHAIRKG